MPFWREEGSSPRPAAVATKRSRYFSSQRGLSSPSSSACTPPIKRKHIKEPKTPSQQQQPAQHKHNKMRQICFFRLRLRRSDWKCLPRAAWLCWWFITRRRRTQKGNDDDDVSEAGDDRLPTKTKQRRDDSVSFFSAYSSYDKMCLEMRGLSRQEQKKVVVRTLSMMSDETIFFSLEGDFDGSSSKGHSPATSSTTAAANAFEDVDECSCGYEEHCLLLYHNPQMPLKTAEGVEPGSYEECLVIARSLSGRWVTLLDRSQSLDPQYRLLGLGAVKRAVMNRLAVPLTLFLEDEDRVLHCWIHTPLGIRHMRCNLKGLESVDDDVDAGRWTGTSKVVDYSIPWFCGGRPVRALQQVRRNDQVGVSIETRCVLPDKIEGRVMFFNLVLIPRGKTYAEKLSADRVLRYAGPIS